MEKDKEKNIYNSESSVLELANIKTYFDICLCQVGQVI